MLIQDGLSGPCGSCFRMYCVLTGARIAEFLAKSAKFGLPLRPPALQVDYAAWSLAHNLS